MLVRILSVIEDGVEKFSTYGTHYAEKVFVGQADLNGTGLYSYRYHTPITHSSPTSLLWRNIEVRALLTIEY